MAFILVSGLVRPNITGTSSNDTIIAGPAENLVSAGAGNDYVLGEDGNDTLNGNQGNDSLFGENDNDILDGNQNNDSLFGQNGLDSLTGDAGRDFLAGGKDSDTLTGGTEADIFFFGSPFEEGVDNITDFEPGIDKIQVDSAEFDIGVTDFNRFNYNSSTGDLLFDQTQFAVLTPNLNFDPSRDISIS